MFSNHVYNLMHQLVVEQKSLWRMRKFYEDDSGDCDECYKFWEKMIKDKEDHIKEISGILKKHM